MHAPDTAVVGSRYCRKYAPAYFGTILHFPGRANWRNGQEQTQTQSEDRFEIARSRTVKIGGPE
jgi:hypothetical protein